MLAGHNSVVKGESDHRPFITKHTDLVLSHLVARWKNGTGCVHITVRFSRVNQSCLNRVFGTLTSIVVRLHRWVPANQPSVEHWSISTSCRLMSTRTTPLQDRRTPLRWLLRDLGCQCNTRDMGFLQLVLRIFFFPVSTHLLNDRVLRINC